MSETAPKLYETMFLVDNTRAKDHVEDVVADLREMVVRAGGEVVNCEKWDERKLAYTIAGRKRATYCICHWNGPPDAVAKLERACRLSEMVLRVLNVCDEDGLEMPSPREDPYPRRDVEDGRRRPRR